MSRVRCVVSCPIDVYAGYGARARDVVKELIRVRPDWDISILSQRWGDCRFGYLQDHREFDLLGRIIPQINFVPDVWIQITIPNEFQRLGKFNIGMTAAMETTICSLEWVKGCNRMDLVITSSEHGRKSLVDSKWIMNNTGEEVSVKVPVEVLFEGVDVSKYFAEFSPKHSDLLQGIESDWNFLCIGHWMQGDIGEDRKNIGYTVKSFLETFKDYPNAPGLVLKTCQAKSSIVDREEVLAKIRKIQQTVQYQHSLPQVYLLSGEVTDTEIASLYRDPRIKAMVSLTKGEGFGRPLLEFAAIGKPIIVSGWSGHIDFLKPEYTMLVGGTLELVHPSAVQSGMIIAEARWFKPSDSDVFRAYRAVFENLDKWKQKAVKQAKIVNISWTKEAMGDRLDSILEQRVPYFPEQVTLTLPNAGEQRIK